MTTDGVVIVGISILSAYLRVFILRGVPHKIVPLRQIDRPSSSKLSHAIFPRSNEIHLVFSQFATNTDRDQLSFSLSESQ